MTKKLQEYWRDTPLASRAAFILAALSAPYFMIYVGNITVWTVRYTLETSSTPAIMAVQQIAYFVLALAGVLAPAVLVALALRSPSASMRWLGGAMALAAAGLGISLLVVTVSAGRLVMTASMQISIEQLFSMFALFGTAYVPIVILAARSIALQTHQGSK